MATKLNRVPLVHIASKIPGLTDHIKMIMPKVNVIPLQNVETPEIKVFKDIEVLLCDGQVLQNNVQHLKSLKWAHCTWAGVENVLKSIGKNQSFVLTRHAGEEFGCLMGEFVMSQIINYERNLPDVYKFSSQCVWHTFEKVPRIISELEIAILGVGVMGLGVARYLKFAGAKINGLAMSEKKENDSKYKDFNFVSTNLGDVIAQSDYIVNCLPSTSITKNLLNNMLDLCSKKPVFINVGRSSIITETNLLLALKNQRISAAILDVFDEEPLPETSALWEDSRVIITPHIAAPSRAKDIAKGFKINFEKYLVDDGLDFVVDFERGY